MNIPDFSITAGVPVEDNMVEIYPHDIYIAGKPLKGTKILVAEPGESGVDMIISFLIPAIRKCSANQSTERRFLIERNLFDRLDPKHCEIDYQLLPDGTYEIVSIISEVAQ